MPDGIAGAAWLDYNNDGHLDLFIPNGRGHDNALFRNNVDGTFTDVAAAAGVTNGEGNVSATVADIDNDGCADIFLTGDGAVMGFVPGQFTSPKLYINNCDGTFTDATLSAGISPDIEGLGAAFGDINNDGYLDIFIASPGDIAIGFFKSNVLYLNNGDRTFTDISASSGVDTAEGACVATFHDYDSDGLIDIYVGNCNFFTTAGGTHPSPFPWKNNLFLNNGDLTFTDIASEVGLAPSLGNPTKGLGFPMGFAFSDYDHDGDMDIFATNSGGDTSVFQQQLYRREADGTYLNVAAEAGVADFLFGWGAVFADVDNDGYDDLIYAGGLPPVGAVSPGYLFYNNQDGTFSPPETFGLENSYTSGVAAGDFDNNGFPDIVVVSQEGFGLTGSSLLLQNVGNTNNWLTVKAIGTVSNRSAIGAVIEVNSGPLKQVKEIFSGTSFASTNSPWLTFGMDKYLRANIKVNWPSGLIELFPGVAANQTVTVVIEGSGIELIK